MRQFKMQTIWGFTMRNKTVKKCICAALSVLLFASALSIGLPAGAQEQQGALGSQRPAITAAYTDSEGNVCDGNALAPGDYTMTLSVSDLYSVANLQFTAYFDTQQLSFSSIGSELLSDSLAQTSGVLASWTGGELSFFIFSSNIGSTTVLPDNGADLLKIDMTVSGDAPVDMQNALTVDEDPNCTYIEVNYGDRTTTEAGDYIYNCYALSDPEDYPGTVYSMTCDLSPDLTKYYDVSAYVGALLSPDSTEGSYPTTGAVVTVQTETGPIEATTDDTGKFTLENVPEGTYEAMITYHYGFSRSFTIIVDGGEIDSQTMIGIVACDWNGDGNVNVNDYMVYYSKYFVNSSSAEYDLGVDITRDGNINVNDYMVYYAFYFQNSDTIEYADTIIS